MHYLQVHFKEDCRHHFSWGKSPVKNLWISLNLVINLDSVFFSPQRFFWIWTIFFFLSLYWICYNIACFVFWVFLAVQRVRSYLSEPGIKAMPLCNGRWNLNHQTTREDPLLDNILRAMRRVLPSHLSSLVAWPNAWLVGDYIFFLNTSIQCFGLVLRIVVLPGLTVMFNKITLDFHGKGRIRAVEY